MPYHMQLFMRWQEDDDTLGWPTQYLQGGEAISSLQNSNPYAGWRDKAEPKGLTGRADTPWISDWQNRYPTPLT